MPLSGNNSNSNGNDNYYTIGSAVRLQKDSKSVFGSYCCSKRKLKHVRSCIVAQLQLPWREQQPGQLIHTLYRKLQCDFQARFTYKTTQLALFLSFHLLMMMMRQRWQLLIESNIQRVLHTSSFKGEAMKTALVSSPLMNLLAASRPAKSYLFCLTIT